MKRLFCLKLPQSFLILQLLIFIQIRSNNANNYNCTKTPTRPFYLIGHMTNSIEEVEKVRQIFLMFNSFEFNKFLKFISLGANSVELDLQFKNDGLLKNFYHGYTCYCGAMITYRYCSYRAEVDQLLNHLRKMTTPGHSEYKAHFVLAYFHLKTKTLGSGTRSLAGKLFADELIDVLFKRDSGLSKLRVIVAVEYTSDYPLIYSFIDRFKERNATKLMSRIGFDVAVDERVTSIQRVWEHMFENKQNVWQGDGIQNCDRFNPSSRVRHLIKIREDNSTQSFVSKVYRWTVDYKSSIRRSLIAGVDGIVTNEVLNVIEVLNSGEFKSYYHLATEYDDPFCVVRDADLEAYKKTLSQNN